MIKLPLVEVVESYLSLKKTDFLKISNNQYGVHSAIRTHDLPLRRRMLYPAELPNHRNVIYYTTWKRKMSNKIYEKIVKTFSLLKEHVNSS